MEYSQFAERSVLLNYKPEKDEVISFLKRQGLAFEEDIEYTMVLLDKEKIIATGSLNDNVLKCIVVDDRYRNLGLMNKVVTHLIQEAYQNNQTHLFVYTKPANELQFNSLGFYTIEKTEDVLLLENAKDGIVDFIRQLKKEKRQGEKIASIVVNCNPFTKGHRYLIETAAADNDWVHVFVVCEEKSVFPSQIRYELVKEGTRDLKNVSIHKGIDYIISSATFPSYFLKEDQDIVQIHARLDLNIFGLYIAKALEVNSRYIGEEPYCMVTKKYNEEMKKVLPTFGIDVHEIPRKEQGGEAVSASRVRKLLKEDDLAAIKKIVPPTTYNFLISKAALPIINKIKQIESRH
ncbi:[citrate (pro-3S)-lyase] ligase [Cellulosilyticum sp. I15G10I2]|uniref:[citrate (pro-3S)-lyase] ligase n=1 Tax=Cellulosilyticum sp. I15G10I2 TaxID=1892843 RepID=UPI00085C324A|nr:[citrate (pro-3S)-lyase] ligase [Cellulosilyticum sp. I15G10I2]